jgi:hypothetical protein
LLISDEMEDKRKMRKLNLSTKLMGGFLVMGLILFIGGFLGPLGISRLGGQLREASEEIPEDHPEGDAFFSDT